ncbi:MAG: helix-turn-helix domain-containing protein [Propionibacteriaceae bacterium]|nr:helix-turn-helix domain-containing protein [Propionibacteriaceae bacterium]
MDRAQLADFLRTRREALQPEDVGLGRGPRRRTSGLRREEVASLSDMSVDYYSRLERGSGPQPSVQMLAAIARGLRLTLNERDHLLRLAGHNAPARTARSDHVSPGLMRIIDRLQDTPAQVMTDLGETLVQTAPARTLFGDETRYTGFARSIVYRWFTDPAARRVYPSEDHDLLSRAFTADLRTTLAKHGPRSRPAQVAEALLSTSAEFAELWAAHEVTNSHHFEKRVQHPDVGVMTLQCQVLQDQEQYQSLLILTASPGTDSHRRLGLLALTGSITTPAEPGVATRP